MAGEPFLHVEGLDQGLVTARDMALLQPGELAKADNCVYMPNDPSIRKSKGRTVYNSTPISGSPTIQGLRLLNFDQSTDPMLVAHAGPDYFYSFMAGETGSFASLAAAVGTGATLEAVQYNNKHYLFNGQGAQNYVAQVDASTRLHGLAAVSSPPLASLTTGSWNSSLGVGYYFFLTTEVIFPNSPDEVESTNIVPSNKIPSVVFTATNINSQSVLITRPDPVANATATHWRVYMAGPRSDSTPPPLSDFKATGTFIQDIANLTVVIGATTLAGTNDRFPTTNATITAPGWTSPANANANDNVFSTTNTHLASTFWGTFGFSGVGTPNGVTVELKLAESGTLGDYSIVVYLTKDGGANLSNPQIFTYKVSGTTFYNRVQSASQPRLITLGGPGSLWGFASLSAAECASANFGVVIRYYVPNVIAVHPTARLDYIRVRVDSVGTSSGTQIFNGAQFPVVITSVAGITTTIGSHGLPPVATTAEMFEGQLVTNDVADASRIVYSLPDNPDYFPSIYFVNFETKQTDEVTLVKRLGDKLLVGQKTQLFRVNYLPRETDAEFDRGRCYETISEGQGVVGVQAAQTFTAPGGPLLMAFVSYSGIHVTDGFQVDTLVDDLDWASTVDLPTAADTADYLKNCILVDYPQNYWLVLYYTPPGSTTNSKALVLHYHPSHRKPNGKLKVTGPLTVAALSATLGRVSDSPVLLTGSTGGKVYVEDRGYTQNQGGTLAVDLRTREMYPWNMDSTGTVEGILIRHDQDATSTVTVQPRLREADGAQTTGEAALTFTTAQAGVVSLEFHFFCDSVQFQLTEPGADAGAGMRISAILATVVSRGAPE